MLPGTDGGGASEVNAGSRVASSGTWRMMQKQGSSGTAPEAWQVACRGGQLRWGWATGVRSDRERARAAEAIRIWTRLEEDCAPVVEDEQRRCDTLGGNRARGWQGRGRGGSSMAALTSGSQQGGEEGEQGEMRIEQILARVRKGWASRGLVGRPGLVACCCWAYGRLGRCGWRSKWLAALLLEGAAGLGSLLSLFNFYNRKSLERRKMKRGVRERICA